MSYTLYIASKSILYTLSSVKKCFLDSLSVLFRGAQDPPEHGGGGEQGAQGEGRAALEAVRANRGRRMDFQDFPRFHYVVSKSVLLTLDSVKKCHI